MGTYDRRADRHFRVSRVADDKTIDAIRLDVSKVVIASKKEQTLSALLFQEPKTVPAKPKGGVQRQRLRHPRGQSEKNDQRRNWCISSGLKKPKMKTQDASHLQTRSPDGQNTRSLPAREPTGKHSKMSKYLFSSS